jgi:hypothetical protein
VINPAAPGKSFEMLWAELSAIFLPGCKVAKYYGKAFVVSAATEVSVTIDSPDVGGEVEIPREEFRKIYADWRNYAYEALSHTNSQETLHVVSIISHVVQTWVRREERAKILESARTAKLRDGVFWVVHYNKHGRHLGPRPSGNPLLLSEVFPTQSPSLLSDLEIAAVNLINARGTSVESLLVDEHDGFAPEVYRSVASRNRLDEIW